jgi:hypothetical protein
LIYGLWPGNSFGEVGSMMAGWSIALGAFGVLVALALFALASGLRAIVLKPQQPTSPRDPSGANPKGG